MKKHFLIASAAAISVLATTALVNYLLLLFKDPDSSRIGNETFDWITLFISLAIALALLALNRFCSTSLQRRQSGAKPGGCCGCQTSCSIDPASANYCRPNNSPEK
jgi:hypothetical protein